MSKDDKSSPSPNHGLPFDPAHLLGVHSMAAAGLPFPHLAHFPNPYSLLTPPPAFPGLFGSLGSIPHPLHAAALSHSLAAASYYGLPKHPRELPSPSPPSSSPSRKGGRSTMSPASTTAAASSSSHRHSMSRSPSSPSTPSAHTSSSSSSSYIPSWPLNGSVYPFSHPLSLPESSQATSTSSSKKLKKSLHNKSDSKRDNSSSSGSSKSSNKLPHTYQHPLLSPLLTIPTAHIPVSLLDSKSSMSLRAGTLPFDPHSLISPYHLSPDLAYLSQSLLLHRPDLGLPSPFFHVPTVTLSSSTSSSSTTASSTAGLEPGQVLLTSASSLKSSSPSLTHPASAHSDDTLKKEKKLKEKSDDPLRLVRPEKSSSVATNVSCHSDDIKDERRDDLMEGRDSLDDRLLVDLSHPSHFMDGDRKKQIAEHIRKRIGIQEGGSGIHDSRVGLHEGRPSIHESLAAGLVSKQTAKHHHQHDWLDLSVGKGDKNKQTDGHGGRPGASHHSDMARLSARRISEESHNWSHSKSERADNYGEETERLKQNAHLKSLKKQFSLGDLKLANARDDPLSSLCPPGMSDTGDDQLDNSLLNESLDMHSSSGSDSERSSLESCKRTAGGSNDEEGSPNKKRCLRLNERELTIPLEHGWSRQTIINGMGRRGIVGEVLYFAPCGKKMKTIPDVMRYLERNPNPDLGRESFSFNTKVNVGQFYEVKGHGSTPVPLSEAEILEKIEMSQGKRARMQLLARKRREAAAREQALARQIMENKLKRRMELQDLTRCAVDLRFEKHFDQNSQKEIEKKERETKVIEKRKEKEQYKMLKQQEKVRVQEQLRKEREMRAQQIIEARNRRQKELEVMRLADAVQRNKEREMKRQQLIIMKEQERERRRQHLLLVKALEQRKRQEERQHQRQVELEVAMELKKPLDDMELKNAKPLPTYPRLKSRLAGRPISDCLMVVEFLNNFGLALNLDKSTIPTLESLERGLMNDSEDDVEDLMSLVMHLLRFALDDVGVPNPKEAVTRLNQKITEMEMTDSTMSEVLRIFVKARGEKEMSDWLTDKPMEALNPTKKAAILAFLCNELLASKVISCEIDKHMDSINNLRRDKWLVEGQLRQLRVFQARKFNKIHKSTDRRHPSVSNTSILSTGDDDTMSSSKMESDDDDDKEEDEDKDEDEHSGDESDGSSSVATCASVNSNLPFEPVDESMTREESDRRIDKLRKQHAAYRQKVFRASLRLRAINVGQDRYKRTYWILPLIGGVYVEGCESGVPPDYLKEMEVKTEVDLGSEVKVEDGEKETHVPDDKGWKDGDERSKDVEKSESEKGDELSLTEKENSRFVHTVDLDGISGVNKIVIGQLGSFPKNVSSETSVDMDDVGDNALRKKCSEDGKSVKSATAVVLGEDGAEDAVLKENISSLDKSAISGVLPDLDDSYSNDIDDGVFDDGCEEGTSAVHSGNSGINNSPHILNEQASVSSKNKTNHPSPLELQIRSCGDDQVTVDDDINKSTEIQKTMSPLLNTNSSIPVVEDKAPVGTANNREDKLANNYNKVLESSSKLGPKFGLNCAINSDKPLTQSKSVIESEDSSKNSTKTKLDDVDINLEENCVAKVEPSTKVELSTKLEPSTKVDFQNKNLNNCVTNASKSSKLDSINKIDQICVPKFDGSLKLDSVSKSDYNCVRIADGFSKLDKLLKSDVGCVSNNEGVSCPEFSDKFPGIASLQTVHNDSNVAALYKLSTAIDNGFHLQHESLSETNKTKIKSVNELEARNSLNPVIPSGKGESLTQSEMRNDDCEIKNRLPLMDGVVPSSGLSPLKTVEPVLTVNGSLPVNKPNPGKVPESLRKDLGKLPSENANSDVLCVPQVNSGCQETLVSVLNHSIYQAYQEQKKEEKPSKKLLSSSMSSSSCAASVADSSALLSSSLLFSAISKLSHPTSPRQLPSSALSLLMPSVADGSLGAADSGEQKSKHLVADMTPPIVGSKHSGIDITSPNVGSKHSGIDITSLNVGSKHSGIDMTAASIMGSSPAPAHSRNPQPLPPFHPSAPQSNTILDLTPPVAHTGQKSSRLSTIPHQTMGPAPYHYIPQSPYIPGVSHHPYGPCSASETLSSLASIISPPPAHHHHNSQSITSSSSSHHHHPQMITPTSSSSHNHHPSTATSSLHHQTPTTTTAPSILLQIPSTPHSAGAPHSKPASTFPSVDAILKGDTPFSSSELLQQAAFQVLRSSENRKLSPISSHLHLSNVSSSSTTTAATTTTTTTTITTPKMTTDDFLSIYTSPKITPEKVDKSDAEVVDHGLWFNILPRMPCDELSLSQPPLITSPYYQQMSTSTPSTNSPFLTSPSALNSLVSHESLLTSLRLLTQSGTMSASPTSCSSTPSFDFLGEFKVPQPPDSNVHADPWDLLRAAQGEAQPIPKNKLHGWWRIYDLAMLRSVMSCTLSRGIRERNLQRSVHRYLDYAQLHCTFDSDKGETDPAIDQLGLTEDKTSKTPEKKKNEVRKTKDKKDETLGDDIKREDDLKNVLDNKEERDSLDLASSITEEEAMKSEVKMEIKMETEEEGSCVKVKKEDQGSVLDDNDYVVPDNPNSWRVKSMFEIEMAALEEVEALEERIFQASLQAKQSWRPNKDTNMKLVDRSITELTDTESYPLDIGIARLLELEANIERRYLKPPLIRSVQLNMTSLSGNSDRSDGDLSDDENVPPGLLLWRQAVVGAMSPAQLSLCTQLLAKSISWEKSIMRVTCQICRKDDNEAELLLCDGCDKGYHTYCFKPKMANIPDGDWYCFECVSKVSGTPHCVVCGVPSGRMVSCQLCPRYIHLECADPALPRMPKRWQCLNCIIEKGTTKKSQKRKDKLPIVQRITIAKLVIKDEQNDGDAVPDPTTTSAAAPCAVPSSDHTDRVVNKDTNKTSANVGHAENEKKTRKRKEKEQFVSTTPKKKEKTVKKERKMKEKKVVEETERVKEGVGEEKVNDKSLHKDLVSCGKLLTEMEKHELGWPFLKPVSKKQFPCYKKFIKTPMDFKSARNKIRSKEYKHRQEFAADMRLIFDNCQTFNEDDSQVGRAGYIMKQYFESRWLELFPNEGS